jgi:Uma2 family endonuclease
MIITKDPSVLPHTLEEFLNWDSNDGFKYEWNDGEVIRFTGMKRKHLLLMRRLNRLFLKTNAHKAGGEIVHEQDVMLTGIQLRRPDLAYFSNEQISNSISSEEEPVPEFTIEVISSFDQINEVKKKILEYFKNGVKVVWLIFPEYQMVEVYTSPRHVTICMENDICSAKPVLDDYEFSVNELFES